MCGLRDCDVSCLNVAALLVMFLPCFHAQAESVGTGCSAWETRMPCQPVSMHVFATFAHLPALISLLQCSTSLVPVSQQVPLAHMHGHELFICFSMDLRHHFYLIPNILMLSGDWAVDTDAHTQQFLLSSLNVQFYMWNISVKAHQCQEL